MDPSALPHAPEDHWDIFCPVVDNYGDVGVCWRLARELVTEHGITVRLWIDDLASARRLIPSLDPALVRQVVGGVDIRAWVSPLPDAAPGAVVIAAFAASLPEPFLEAMALRSPRPAWINLEYLSAEDWVAGCHRLPSPHPRLPLVQHFFFPGLDARTGGLLREADYDTRRQAFSREAFRQALELPPEQPGERMVSLFTYENPALPELLEMWSKSPAPVCCLVPEGRVLPGLAAHLGLSGLRAGDKILHEALTVCVLPFVEQARYDELLWACDLNFVRGEDSFVRAQWAGVPFVWHIYAQEEDAHLAKLQAFMTRYLDGVEPAAALALQEFWLAWNRGEGVAAAWPSFESRLPLLGAHGSAWSARLRESGELAANLVRFCKVEIE
ncbi:elongation factor P maturation arginine rhamnosyltransferase EarP [Zoogloea sp.]|uniref:elongation factor P maturation arginine rhamnosyltransferase EarP n=1 Tax=Zoogloea sp. TaxID=49181 RepID=UPI0014157D9A|nr:MAG: elongation factor P maturation arginine rhamnosyltransferase EarP [Zoogloea sp.]